MIIPPLTSNNIFINLINDVIVIGLASLFSYLISMAVVRQSSKSILSSIRLIDILDGIKKLLSNEEVQQHAAKFLSKVIKFALDNEEINAKIRIFIVSALNDENLRSELRDFLLALVNDKQLRDELKKSIADVISQYPVLEKILTGGNSAKKKKD